MKPTALRSRVGGSAVARVASQGLFIFLLLLIYDGAVRKWLLPDAEQLIFIIKDVLLTGLFAYALFGGSRNANISIQPIVLGLFAIYAIWILLEIINPNLPSILVGIWGLKSHLLYASLIVLLPLVFSNLDDCFRWLVKAYPWIVVPVCALAFVQLAADGDSLINQQVRGGSDMIAYFGEAGLVRVTGTFSYISGMSSFVQLIIVLGIGLFLGGARATPFLVGLGFALAALPATGSRSVIAVAAGAVAIMLVAAYAARLIGGAMMMRLIAAISVLGTISALAQDEVWTALQQRAQSAAESHGDNVRVFTTFTNAFDYFDAAGFFGFGSGSANYGAPALVADISPFSWLPLGEAFEEESGRIVLELGIIGWVISLAMRIAVFFWAARLALNGLTRTARMAAVMALPVVALGMYQGNGVFASPIAATHYWFCVALLAMAQYEHRLAWSQRARLWNDRIQTGGGR